MPHGHAVPEAPTRPDDVLDEIAADLERLERETRVPRAATRQSKVDEICAELEARAQRRQERRAQQLSEVTETPPAVDQEPEAHS